MYHKTISYNIHHPQTYSGQAINNERTIFSMKQTPKRHLSCTGSAVLAEGFKMQKQIQAQKIVDKLNWYNFVEL